jgi:tRNA uridine 5-carbamoylmethylation protein Kti12
MLLADWPVWIISRDMPAQVDTPILILTGPPGVGKSTTAEILAARSSRSVHLESDAFFRFIRSGHVEPWKPESHEQNQLVMRLVAEAAAGYAAAGYFTVVDGIVIPQWFLVPLREAFRQAGHDVAYAVLRAPFATCAARARDRERVPLAEPEVIERLWRSFEDLGELERNAIDLSGEGPEEAADLVAAHLSEGLLAI